MKKLQIELSDKASGKKQTMNKNDETARSLNKHWNKMVNSVTLIGLSFLKVDFYGDQFGTPFIFKEELIYINTTLHNC